MADELIGKGVVSGYPSLGIMAGPVSDEAIALYGLFFRVGGVGMVCMFQPPSFFERCVLAVGALHLVERHVAADGKAERLYAFQLAPLFATVPYFHHRLLHYVLGIGSVESDAQCQPEELVLQRQDVGAEEADFFHPL